MRSVLVSRDTLAGVAASLGLGGHLFLGKGESADGGRERKSNLANAVEALIAAVYLDGGMAAARRVTTALFADALAGIDAERDRLSYKNMLQRYGQERGLGSPEYVLTACSGPQHRRAFEVEARLGGGRWGGGAGRTRRRRSRRPRGRRSPPSGPGGAGGGGRWSRSPCCSFCCSCR